MARAFQGTCTVSVKPLAILDLSVSEICGLDKVSDGIHMIEKLRSPHHLQSSVTEADLADAGDKSEEQKEFEHV